MKKSKPVNEDGQLTYQKVPVIGKGGFVYIIAFIVLLGLMAYSIYSRDRKVLTCVHESSTVVDNNKIPYEATIKLIFKKEIYSSGTIEQVFDLTNFSDEIFNKVSKSNLCENVLKPSESSNNYAYDNCKQSVDGKKIIVKSDYKIKANNEDIKMSNEKTIFVKSGYKCQ